MTSRKRDESPKPTPPVGSDGDAAGKEKVEEKVKFVPPPRPAGLRESVLTLYGLLGAAVLFWAIIGQSMVHPVPEGKYEMKDGKIIDINDFPEAELGPYPKCHPHFEEHKVIEGNVTKWVKNADAPKGGPYPVGHPENPEWVKTADAKVKADNAENRFKWKGLQVNFHLLVLATIAVLLGSKHGVLIFTEPAETREGGAQVLQSEDAYWFPILGSGMLLGLFLVLKYVGSYYVKTAITCWIVTMCTGGLGKNTQAVVAVFRNVQEKPLFRIPYFEEDVSLMQLIGSCVGVGMAACYIMHQNFIVNNVFGLSFCLLGIRMVGLNSIKVGAIMLIGLFFYDVFWVFGSKSIFGSNVMVSVAMGVEAPIKLMFPRDLSGCGTLRSSMLGLGDIVVPGIFISFLAKWDAVKIGEKAADSFVYLNTVMVAYFFSLVTTVGIMLFFNAAQPALLYIVPFVLITTCVVAASRGELKALWAFEIPDESEPEATDEKKTEEKKKD